MLWPGGGGGGVGDRLTDDDPPSKTYSSAFQPHFLFVSAYVCPSICPSLVAKVTDFFSRIKSLIIICCPDCKMDFKLSLELESLIRRVRCCQVVLRGFAFPSPVTRGTLAGKIDDRHQCFPFYLIKRATRKQFLEAFRFRVSLIPFHMS